MLPSRPFRTKLRTMNRTGRDDALRGGLNRESPVGVFDSGVGGLSVLRHIRSALPNETLLYCADSSHAPYGAKSAEQIRARALALTGFLVEQGAKAIVVACNTATAAAVTTLRAHFPIPIIGMEPAVKPAAAATNSGVVGVLATVGTLSSAQFAALLEHYGKEVEVVTQACHGLVECVERGQLDAPATRDLVRRYVAPLLARGADTIVLGCTHYPFLRELIQQEAGSGVAIIDTGIAVARQLQRRLAELGLLNGAGGGERFWTSGAVTEAEPVVLRLWGEPVAVARLPERAAGREASAQP
jgi:glutamate racemase